MAEQKPKAKGRGAKPDFATIAGIALAVGGILGGLLLEGGELKQVSQYTAALIVLGGTFGATLVSTPLATFVGAFARLKSVLFVPADDAPAQIEEIIGYATKARKSGLVSLEADVDQIADRFVRKALTLAVDGTDLQELRKMLELEISLDEHHAEAESKVFEAAGGYAPTVGIIGAVLGLIQVMKHIANTDEVGKGIAVAFVATVYGVGVANILLLPAAAKIKSRAQHEVQMKELVLEGVLGIVEGLNPKLIRTKLEAFAPPEPASGKSKKGAAAAQASAAAAGD